MENKQSESVSELREALRKKELELAQARSEAVQSARAKSEFLAHVSHEFRTPLNGVLGMIELLLADELTARQREALETIKASGESLLSVVAGLLEFAELEAGRLKVERKAFDLIRLVEEATARMSRNAEEKGLELLCSVDPSCPSEVEGDPLRISQVLISLLSNAVKFTEHGEIEVTCNAVRETEGMVTVRFAVRDTGIGIPADGQANIFESFEQADGSLARQYGGLGLGLAVSRQLVGLMGGRMGLRSVEGSGSEFWFELPLRGHRVSRIEADLELLGLNVLVVDDNSTNRLVLQSQLRSWGCLVTAVSSGHDAMELLGGAGSQRFDLVITDIQMPGMDGIELRKAIAAKHAELPVLALGSCILEQPEGFAGVLEKPVRQADLRRAFGSVLSARTKQPLLQVECEDAGCDPLSGLRVLVVDESIDVQRFVSRILERAGAKPTVMSDLPPSGEGFDFVLSALGGHVFDCPVISLGSEFEGAYGSLKKPIKPHELLAAARKCARRERAA